MQHHSLHDQDRPDFSTSSDLEPPSGSSCSWTVAASTCSSVDHMQAAAAPAGSFFRQLFAEETDEAADSYVEDLLQLQLPPAAEAVPSLDNIMSSSDNIFHPRHHSYASLQLHPCVPDLPPFSVESYMNSGATSAAVSNDHMPHTLEFVSPPTSTTSSALTFQGSSSNVTNNSSRSRPGVAAAALLPDPIVSPSDSPHCKDHDGAYYSKPNKLVNADDHDGDDQQHTFMSQYDPASSCKKAKLQGSEQCHSAGTDPSPLMISKVQSARSNSKEKLGERINALQQLVSPFGKTDTASVLSEAIGYIKFLQEQVQVLSSPYMKHTTTLAASTRQDLGGESASDLRSRGLCLVPVSCTINVANNNNFNIGADYWASTPAVGGTTGGSTTTNRYSASS